MSALAASLRRYANQPLTATWLSYIGFNLVRKTYAVLKRPLNEHFGLYVVHVAYPWTLYLVTCPSAD